MTKRGLAVREPDPDDGRGSRAVLTATGLETLRRATPGHAASVRKLFFGNINDDDWLVSREFSLGCVSLCNATGVRRRDVYRDGAGLAADHAAVDRGIWTRRRGQEVKGRSAPSGSG